MLNIAIDGTAGSGKGTIAKRLAEKLKIGCLDTGAIYRSIAYFIIDKGIDPSNVKDVCKALKEINFKVKFKIDELGNKVQINLLEDQDLGDKIRQENISEASSFVSQIKEVRQYAVKIQHEIADKNDIVVEGRDIGTVVLPNAKYKFFLTASPEVRAFRRINQLGLSKECFKDVLKEIKDRDERDLNRKISPLKVAENAIYIDNSNQTPEETLDLILSYIK